ncbi:MAG: hypothetical protein KH032_10945 [[Clostridium] spiroforme]|uniref:ECF transporter S component n=1 Tax=Thomasclavelia spiroformis TaxID=29348 RepID=UPI001DD9DCEE|nr:ECF transporter S component [Thomasclavelia spiroformis]MBS7217742.1 hypothetical protein [Thomasclavelia spiroformis]
MNQTVANWGKQDKEENQSQKVINKPNDSRQLAIRKICQKLATPGFDKEDVYKDIKIYLAQHKRWLYSTVSNYLFSLNPQDRATYTSNMDILLSYVDELTIKNEAEIKDIKACVEKLWDHSNLATAQTDNLHDSEDTFSRRFQKNLIPFKSEFAHEMNMQFISLIAIFTALSFIVFGGISSLDNIFNDAQKIPVLTLVIMGSIWSLFICNLIFVFMLFVSKFTKIPIKASEKEYSSLSEKYPFIVWCNYIFLLILSVASWIGYIDYSNSGSWMLSFSKQHSILSCILGFVVITVMFSMLAILVLKHPKPRNKE